MSDHQALKRAARAHAKEHGISYTAALRILREQSQTTSKVEPGTVDTRHPSVPDTHDRPWHEFPLGLTGEDEAIWDVRTDPHLLVAGSAGSGKSVLLRNVILGALTSSAWRVVGVDPKGVELSWLTGLPGVDGVAPTLGGTVTLLERAGAEMERRYELMGRLGVDSFHELASQEPDIRAVLVVVDDMGMLTSESGDTEPRVQEKQHVWHLLGRFARLGRAAGVHLALGVQSVGLDTIPNQLRVNVSARVGCGPLPGEQLRLLFGAEHRVNEPQHVRGLAWFSTAITDPTPFQSYYLSVDDVSTRAQRMDKKVKDDGSFPLPFPTENATPGWDTFQLGHANETGEPVNLHLGEGSPPVTYITGRVGSGKTVLATRLAAHLTGHGGKVVYFTPFPNRLLAEICERVVTDDDAYAVELIRAVRYHANTVPGSLPHSGLELADQGDRVARPVLVVIDGAADHQGAVQEVNRFVNDCAVTDVHVVVTDIFGHHVPDHGRFTRINLATPDRPARPRLPEGTVTVAGRYTDPVFAPVIWDVPEVPTAVSI